MTFFRIGNSAISFSDQDFMDFCVIMIVMLLVLGTCAWVGFFVLRVKDNSKPLQSRKVKILEKPSKAALVEWCVVEFENGRRTKLRNFHPNTILLAVGDEGLLDYKGITIQAFHPSPKFLP